MSSIIYQTTSDANMLKQSPFSKADLWIAGLLALVFLSHSWIYANRTPIGVPPDEWAHLTYVNEVVTGDRLIPAYSDSFVLPANTQKNYLGHPPLYYSALGFVGRLLHWNVVEDFIKYRLLSAAFVAFGLFLWALVARSFGYSRAWTIPLLLAVNAIPMFPYLAGSVNNDNLAYLAAAVAVFGIVHTDRLPRASWYIGALGLGIALLTKATIALFLIVVFCTWIGQRFFSPRRDSLNNRHFIASACLVLLLTGGYYIYVYTTFGAFFPRGELYARNEMPEGALHFVGFLGQFIGGMISGLPEILSHASTFPLAGAQMLRGIFLLLLTLPIVAWVWSMATPQRSEIDKLRDSILVAILVTLAAHILVVWAGYKHYGILAGVQPRYYNYLLPAIFIVAFQHYNKDRIVRMLLALFAICSIGLSIAVPPRVMKVEAARHAPPPPTPTLRFDIAPVEPRKLRGIGLAHAPAGNIDELTRANGVVSVRGWAMDMRSTAAPARLDIYYNAIRVGSVKTGFARPDVASALNDENAQNSGFQFRISGVPANVTGCDFQFAVVQSAELPVALPAPGCP